MAKQGRSELSDRTKKILAGASIAVFVILTLLIAWFVGRPLIHYIQEPEKFRAWVDSAGAMSRVYFLGIQILQVVVAIIPGEPIEMGAGYAFGAVEGTLLCMAGTIIGSMLVYFFVRRFGVKAVEIFFPIEKIENLRFLNTAKKRDALMFLLVFIPGTPKDLLAYFAPTVDLALHHLRGQDTLCHHQHHRRRRAGREKLRLCRRGHRCNAAHQRHRPLHLQAHLCQACRARDGGAGEGAQRAKQHRGG